MKAQTRLGSLWESGQNILVGYSISVAATYFLGPWFDIKPSVGNVLGFGLAMTVVSVARQYLIRRYHEWKRGRNVPPDFLYIVEEIAAERTRQITGEGYSLAHDDEWTGGEIAKGAAAYALLSAMPLRDETRPQFVRNILDNLWPWHDSAFKPSTPRRELVKAAAMLVAELGRRDRAKRRSL